MKKKILIIIPLVVIMFLLLSGGASASIWDWFRSPNEALSPNAITPGKIEDLIEGVARWLMRVGGVILIIFIVYIGIKMMTAGSDANKFSEAVSSLKYVLIGGLVILGVGVILATLDYIVRVPLWGT